MSDTKNMDAAPASGAPDLPPLPEPWITDLRKDIQPEARKHYAEDQMIDYARAALAQAAQASLPAAADAGALSYEDAFNAAWAETSKLNRISPGAPPSPKFIEWFRAGWDARPTASGATITGAPASPASAPVAPTVEFVMLSDMVEGDHPDHGRGYFCTVDCVRTMEATPTAALAVKVEAQQAGVVEGWQLVPKEPTPEMIDNTAAFDLEGEDDTNNAYRIVYCAMLAAAPLPPVVARKDGDVDLVTLANRDGWQEGMQEAQALLASEIEDAARLDWLETKVVNVRDPLRYGSRDMFWSSPPDDDGETGLSDIRKAIDAARLPGTNGSGVEHG